MKVINVTHKDYGWFSEEPITVQRFLQYDETDKELVWCNHAQNEEEEVENEINRIAQPDITWTDRVTVCLKCKAYRFDGDDEWQDAPFEGVR